jgi:hypothetical protein
MRIFALRRSGRCKDVLSQAGALFPPRGSFPGLNGFMGENDPVGLSSVVANVTLAVFNDSSQAEVIIFRSGVGECKLPEMVHAGYLRFKTDFGNAENQYVEIAPRTQRVVPLKVFIEIMEPHTRWDVAASMETALINTRAFYNAAATKISGLFFEIVLRNGESVRKEFGLKIINPERLSPLINMDVVDFLQAWQALDLRNVDISTISRAERHTTEGWSVLSHRACRGILCNVVDSTEPARDTVPSKPRTLLVCSVCEATVAEAEAETYLSFSR